MQNPIRLFSLMTHQTPYFGDVGSGGQVEIDQALASALCAGMPKKWYIAARLKWSMDYSGVKFLKYQLWQEAAGIAHYNKWKIPKGKEYIRRMAELAIIEMIQPEIYSPLDAWKLKANYIGCGKSQWYGLWCGRYEEVYQTLNDWTNRAYGYLASRQKEKLD